MGRLKKDITAEIFSGSRVSEEAKDLGMERDRVAPKIKPVTEGGDLTKDDVQDQTNVIQEVQERVQAMESDYSMDVTRAVLDFFSNGHMFKTAYTSALHLAPKGVNPFKSQLQHFVAASDLEANLNKSMIYLDGVHAVQRQILSEAIGMELVLRLVMPELKLNGWKNCWGEWLSWMLCVSRGKTKLAQQRKRITALVVYEV
ncbi:hypothetical protein AKJ16_DCAP02954 [Drosera capensis]